MGECIPDGAPLTSPSQRQSLALVSRWHPTDCYADSKGPTSPLPGGSDDDREVGATVDRLGQRLTLASAVRTMADRLNW
jgi:hypothetical protein